MSLLIFVTPYLVVVVLIFFKPLHLSTYKQCKEEMFLGHQLLQTVFGECNLEAKFFRSYRC